MAEPFDIVIFGGSGDLAFRKIVPALYRAFGEAKLPEGSRVVPCYRGALTASEYIAEADAALREHLLEGEYDQAQASEFSSYLTPCALDIKTADARWQTLADLLNTAADRVRVFYLAIPPAIFGVCCQHLSEYGLVSANSRLVVEKPLGYNAASANAINDEIARYFDETAIYRIDHYLGKETVQNLMALRFTNVIFEQLWDAKSIDHVQISISETVGLEGRAGFYNEAGALRDMVQNHLLQLLCLVAMESPHKMKASSIRAEKVKVLEALRPMVGDEVFKHTVRGQYVAGNHNGKLVPGYLEELGEPNSSTETFVALRAYVDNWRWARVPFYLRTGKRMKQRSAEIVIQFKGVSHRVYEPSAGPLLPNRLVIRLQPEETIQLIMMSKDLNTLDMQLQPASLNLNFSESYKHVKSDAYKRLILDAVAANSSLFIHRDEVANAWAWIDPIIEAWQQASQPPHLYRAGTWGPDESDELLAEDGFSWFNSGEALK
ncbi:MAG: glucose-6-phosphate dehydrogenase [Spongiibacter sp.]|uniref:Glucose-6-phosphate 1-dehydrogenase n=1 Tax=Spongiibacter thalassae TaxID=2721624 RepID=A0ABX1GHY3_9GAMM|nr:glucose-6-phosphate dehydrogenase [Spongiibacter thalassae]MDX1504497.1 glucose-6-phosphate dehydrogenase [Spongiibacter sp.]NKI18033.1 glucose-6-phosphate dehydrogenase [Spongiibacter thalassae]